MNIDAAMKKMQKLNGTVLKLIAALFMVIDHTGYMFFPMVIWIRKVGRIAFPVFAFFVAEGFFYTKDRRRYLLRMLLFAVISELPFDLAFFGKWYWKYQNVMFSFVLAILALMIFEKSRENRTWWGFALGLLGIAGCAWVSVLINTDYSYYAVILVAVFTAGWLLGAPVGIGTLITVFGIGTIMQAVFHVLHFEPRDVTQTGFIEAIQILLKGEGK